MIITRTEIRSLTEKLRGIIAIKEQALKDTLITYNSWKEIDQFLNNLNSTIKKMQLVIFTEEKEIQNLKLKFQELAMSREINTSDPRLKKQVDAYMETKLVVASPSDQLNQRVESINTYLSKLKKFLLNRLDNKWLPSRNGKLTDRSLGNKIVAKHHSDKSARNKFNSKAIDEALALIATEDKPFLQRKPSCPSTRNGFMFNTKAVEEARKLLEMDYKGKEKYKIIEKLDYDIEKDGLTDSREQVETTESLTKRKCSLCPDTKELIHLDCCGDICVKCIKTQILKEDPRVLINPYEAEGKQNFMCACPVHKVSIGVEVLQQVFEAKELEKLSIEALKRQQRVSINRKIKHPNICVNCKNVVQNEDIYKECQKCYMAKYLIKY